MDTKIHETRYSDLAKFEVFERESGDFRGTFRYVIMVGKKAKVLHLKLRTQGNCTHFLHV